MVSTQITPAVLVSTPPRQQRLQESFDLLRLHALNPQRYPYLLESVVHGTAQSRYDILFAFPGASMDATGQDFLSALDQQWQSDRKQDETTVDLPFSGGWFLYLGYELVAQIEPRLCALRADAVLPAAFATRIPAAAIRDHQSGCCHLVCEPGAEPLLAKMAGDIARLPSIDKRSSCPPVVISISEDEPRRFLAGVERIRDYIREGDVFQVNLSRAWRLTLAEGDAVQLYRRLRDHNPAPFAALVSYGGKSVISSSPERLVSVKGDRVSVRPIAGTRPRSADAAADAAYAKTLLDHPKERAEHVMLIDLERNDLGRLCVPGSVVVDEMMVLESYAHVHHIVSNVSGTLRPGTTPAAVIRAVFPGGTITGCPKVRCMEIIHEMEQEGRGPYTGSVGYLSHSGEMDLNILIRTMVLDGQQLHFRTGAGIVNDSLPDAELAETRAKALGLLRALGVETT